MNTGTLIILIILLVLIVASLCVSIHVVYKFGIKYWYVFILPFILSDVVSSIEDEEHYREIHVPNAIDLQEGRAEIKTTITDKTIIWNNRNNYDTVVLKDTVQTLR